MEEITWKDIRADKTEVDVCHEEARLGGQTARIWAPSRQVPGKEWEADAAGKISYHRSDDHARSAAEKRLRAAAGKAAS